MKTEDDSDLVLEGVIHDLNNVFETVQEAAEILSTDQKWTWLASTIQRSIERGHRILGGISESAPASVELELVLANAIEFTSDLLRAVHAPNLEFQQQIEPGILLRGRPASWERVLFNLFINASQALRHQGGEVQVRARRADEGIEITVADAGPGIPSEILPHIFEPHFSTNPARSGLGLHIVASIVERNGGSVTALNRPDSAGAKFLIWLPSA